MARPSTATFTGKVVVLTAALVTAALTLGALWCWTVAQEPEGGERLLTAATGALATLTALAARTRPDPGEAGPVEVAATEPLPVTDVEADETRLRVRRTRTDAG